MGENGEAGVAERVGDGKNGGTFTEAFDAEFPPGEGERLRALARDVQQARAWGCSHEPACTVPESCGAKSAREGGGGLRRLSTEEILVRQAEQIASLQLSVRRLERVAFPSLYHPSLADKIRDGWSEGRKLIGLTVPQRGSTNVDPVWGAPKHASNELRKAALDFDAAQEQVIALVAKLSPSVDAEVADGLRDLIVTLGDNAASCQVAAREVDA